MSQRRQIIIIIVVTLLVYIGVSRCAPGSPDIQDSVAPPPPAVTATSEPVVVKRVLPTPSREDTEPDDRPTAVAPTSASSAEPTTSPEASRSPVQTSDKPSATKEKPKPTATAHQSEVTPTATAIPQSPPVQLYQPDTELNLTVLTLPAEYSNPIYPPSKREAYWDPRPVITDQPYSSYAPGTSTPDLSVIAGHTGTVTTDAAFNKLYDWQSQQFQVGIGDEVWVKTEASGERWLVYTLVNRLYVPKGQLADSVEVWGTDANPKPNHLVLIGCRQVGLGRDSQENFVLDFVFTGTR